MNNLTQSLILNDFDSFKLIIKNNENGYDKEVLFNLITDNDKIKYFKYLYDNDLLELIFFGEIIDEFDIINKIASNKKPLFVPCLFI